MEHGHEESVLLTSWKNATKKEARKDGRITAFHRRIINLNKRIEIRHGLKTELHKHKQIKT